MDKTYSDQIDALVERHQSAEGPLIKIANYAGGQVESILSKLDSAFNEKGKRANNAIRNIFFYMLGEITLDGIPEHVTRA